jgi:uncharacterized protein
VVRDVTAPAVGVERRATEQGSRRVRGLYHYPIKSCRGTALDEAVVGTRGIVADRTWMVVDDGDNFLTQRELPRMALISPRLDDGVMHISAPGMPELRVGVGAGGARRSVTIWGDQCAAIDQGADAAAWFSGFLGVSCRLVRFPDDAMRPVDATYAGPEDQVGFADGFSFLLASRASLQELNRRLAVPLPMNRFRPNIVVDGVEPFEEDTWTRIRIDGIPFSVVKPCARCAITTVDQNTAERAKEPLRTLATFRHVAGKGVMFGQNLVHHRTGVLRVGAVVEVLD